MLIYLTVHLLLLFLFCLVEYGFPNLIFYFYYCSVRQLAASHHHGELLNFNRHRERTRSLLFVPRASYILLLCDWLTPSRNFSSEQYSTGNSFSLCVFFPVTQTSTRRDIIYSNLGLQGLSFESRMPAGLCGFFTSAMRVVLRCHFNWPRSFLFCCLFVVFLPEVFASNRYSLVHILYCPANANRISETTTIGVDMGGKNTVQCPRWIGNRQAASWGLRTRQREIYQTVIVISTEKPIAQKSAICFFFFFPYSSLSSIFLLERVSAVFVYMKRRERKSFWLDLPSWEIIFILVDWCLLSANVVPNNPPLCHSDDFNQLFLCAYLSAVRAASLFAQLAALFLDRHYYYLHSQPHFSGSNLFTRHESRQLMWKMQTHVSKIQKMIANRGGQPVGNYHS